MMRILSIDTSCKTAMAAVSEGQKIIASISLHDDKTHSVKMLPAVKYILEASDTCNADIGAVAVTNGPGSYTGLRIGVTTAKTFAYALGVPLIGISSLAALAASCITYSKAIICPIIDARNSRVYAALYQNGSEIMPASALYCEELCNVIKRDYPERHIIFTGDGVNANIDLLKSLDSEMFTVAPEMLRLGNPAALAKIAYEKYTEAVSDGSINEMSDDRLRVEYYKKYTDEI